jgi:molecular chaperone GrpE
MPDQQAARAGPHGHTPADGTATDSESTLAPTKPEVQVEQLSARVAELEADVSELDDRWRRALADLDNLRKRMAREIERERAAERARAVEQFLPIVDNLDLTLEHANADPDALIEGVRVVRDQAVAAIERLGFERVDDVDVPFDPARHEAMATVTEPEVRPGTVVRVVRPGYGKDDKQLRPAGVVVATGTQ